MQSSTQPPAPKDFDIIVGEWTLRHRRLGEGFCGCKDRTQFHGTTSPRRIRGGFGNVEDRLLHYSKEVVRAAAFRSFDPKAAIRAIRWPDGRAPHNLDTPTVDGCPGNVVTSFADDSLGGKPINARSIWNANPRSNPTWEQARSVDAGATRETNRTTAFTRAGT